MRAAIYTRISRDDAGTGLGVQRQREDCEALCTERNWLVAEVYEENDTSAYSGPRPVYDRLISDITERKVDIVIAWAPERLHRSVRELEEFILLLERTRVRVETVKAGVWELSTSHGRLIARLLGAISRHESERMGERMSRASLQAQQSGLWHGSIPFGMRRSMTPRMPEVDPADAEVVRWIFDRLCAGDSANEIAGDLNAVGAPMPRRGRGWDHTSVLRLIACPALAGMVRCDGHLVEGLFTGPLDRATWLDYQAAKPFLRKRYPGATRGPHPPTLLGGILRCAEHGYVCMAKGNRSNRGYGTQVVGRCRVTISRYPANEVVTSAALLRLGQPETLKFGAAEIRDLAAGPRDANQLLTEARGAVTKAGRSPDEIWASWTMPQRRDVLRLMFQQIAVHHVGIRNGGVMKPDRLQLQWRIPKQWTYG